MFSDRVTVQLPGTIYGTLSLKELSDAQFNDIEDRVVIRIIQEQPYENSGLDVGLGLVKSIHLDGMERQVNEPRSWKWIAEDLPAGAYRISSKPYGLGAEVFLEPGLASEVNLSIEALAYVDLSFQDTESGNKVSLRVARAKLIVPAFDEIESVQLWRNRKNVAMDRVEFASSPGIIYLDVFDSVYGTYNVEIEVAHGENVIVLPVSKTYLIEVEILGSGEVVAQGPCWWKEVQFFRGGVVVEILNRAYPIRPGKVFAENGVRFCVMQALTVGTGALEVVFPSIEGHKPLGTINIPPASKEETGPRRVAVSLEE